MTAPSAEPSRLDTLIARSYDLDAALARLLEPAEFPDAPRVNATLGMCRVALDHGAGFRTLCESRCFTSAFAVFRAKYEALVRATWLLYAAKDGDIHILLVPLSLESQLSAKGWPDVSGMLKALAPTAPQACVQMLNQFKEQSWPALNSFVHSGVHAFHRADAGYPEELLDNILRQANALSTMIAMLIAILTGDSSITSPVSRIQRDFQDCLPPLLA